MLIHISSSFCEHTFSIGLLMTSVTRTKNLIVVHNTEKKNNVTLDPDDRGNEMSKYMSYLESY